MFDVEKSAPQPGRFIRGRLLPLILCLLALAGSAYVSVAGISSEERRDREWRAASPCPASAPADTRADCVTTLSGVVARVEATMNKNGDDDWLHFRGGEPVDRLNVLYDTATAFAPGDRVTLAWWRGDLMTVAGAHRTADENVPRPGGIAGGAVLCILAAGCLAVLVLVRRRRDGLPVVAGEPARPNASAFLVALAVAAVWAVPLAGVRPDPPVAVPVAAAGVLTVLVLLARAWRVSGRTAPVTPRPLPEGEDVFLPARFLQEAPHDPGLEGSHIVLGAGPMALLLHGGPGRFAGKEIRPGRFTVRGLRHPRRTTEHNVPAGWYVAELLDSGTPVRLTAAPADLLLLVQELERAEPSQDGTV
ncbi:hypothetical protein [Streptomyces sp. NPDC056796]|uniref:hypothetical protein n=1 Tax=Streptomyces sp. NPDC056796 TaxID=3345947 RepID=UPI0036AE9B61